MGWAIVCEIDVVVGVNTTSKYTWGDKRCQLPSLCIRSSLVHGKILLSPLQFGFFSFTLLVSRSYVEGTYMVVLLYIVLYSYSVGFLHVSSLFPM